MEDKICHNMPKVQSNRGRQVACDKVPTHNITNTLGQGINSFGKWMLIVHMEPMIRHTILAQLKVWRTGETNQNEQKGQGTYKTHSQDQLGWQYALEGGHYYSMVHPARTVLATNQITGLCKMVDSRIDQKTVECAWDIWRHKTVPYTIGQQENH